MKTVTQFSKEIGISRQTVYRKIKQLGLLQELQKSDSYVTELIET